jgi:hypothetical protein
VSTVVAFVLLGVEVGVDFGVDLGLEGEAVVEAFRRVSEMVSVRSK